METVLTEKDRIYVVLDSKLSNMYIDDKEYSYSTILFRLERVLAKSFNFQDDSFRYYNESAYFGKGYQIIDFLYFSAITITTLGFGDIIPNDTLVRVLIMVQTLSGLIVIGLFISELIKPST